MDYRSQVIEALLENGCSRLEELNEDQEIWQSPISGRKFVVERSIRSKTTANQILQQAGLAPLP
jgi:hypothetical protein